MKLQLKHMLVNATSGVLLALPSAALAQGLTGVQPFAGTSQSDLVTAIIRIVNFLLILAGIVAAIYIIYGGVKYISSQGDPDAADEGKKTILYAVMGLIVIGLAAALVNFIITGIRTT